MILRQYLQDKREEEREKARESARKTHKCHGCVWGTWAGNKYVCPFGRVREKQVREAVSCKWIGRKSKRNTKQLT